MTGGELYIYISIYGCIDPKVYTSIYVYMTRPPIFRGCRHMCASLSLAGCTVLFSFAGLRFTAVSMNVMHVICAGQPTANAAPLLFYIYLRSHDQMAYDSPRWFKVVSNVPPRGFKTSRRQLQVSTEPSKGRSPSRPKYGSNMLTRRSQSERFAKAFMADSCRLRRRRRLHLFHPPSSYLSSSSSYHLLMLLLLLLLLFLLLLLLLPVILLLILLSFSSSHSSHLGFT